MKYVLDMGWQALFKDLEITPQDVLRHAHLPLDLLNQEAPTITGEEYLKLWEGLAHVLRDEPAFPLRFAQSIPIDAFSPPIFACLCSTDLNQALRRIAKYKVLVGPVRMGLHQDERRTVTTFSGEIGPLPPSLAAFELAFWVHVTRTATREHIVPEAVTVPFDVERPDLYEAYFGIPLGRASEISLTFSAADARRPFLSPNSAMWSIFEPELRRRMGDLTKEASYRERVRACLIEMLAGGEFSIDEVAARLAVSSRTLQRRLREEGTTFQQVLDDLREELARHYLSTSDYTTGQIAFLLGYEEPSSLFRAVRSWTGQTPETLRIQLS